MMNQVTVNKLHDMRLSAMAEAYREQMKKAICPPSLLTNGSG